jgi:GNAT superfamily N-acetyltransferase
MFTSLESTHVGRVLRSGLRLRPAARAAACRQNARGGRAIAVEVRAIAPEDESLYRELLVSLTDRDRFLRFFHTVAAIGPTEVLPFVASRPDMVGLIAVEDGKALGAAHGFIDVERSTAEFAIEVRPDYRHRGIGSKLTATMIEELKRRGVRELIAHSLWDNSEFGLIASEAHMQARSEGAGVNLWRLRLSAG